MRPGIGHACSWEMIFHAYATIKHAVLTHTLLRLTSIAALPLPSPPSRTQMTYIHLLHLPDSTSYLPYPSEATPYLINAHIGTHVTQRCVSHLTYRCSLVFGLSVAAAGSVLLCVSPSLPSYHLLRPSLPRPCWWESLTRAAYSRYGRTNVR